MDYITPDKIIEIEKYDNSKRKHVLKSYNEKIILAKVLKEEENNV